MSSDWSFETLAVHAGFDPDTITGAVNVPIFQTSTYKQTAVGEYPFSDYGRVDNPTRTALQDSMAALEAGANGIAFSSGLAAADTLLRTLEPGDHLIMDNDAYGGTYRLVAKILTSHGLAFSTVDLSDLEAVNKAFTPETKMVWAESPTNPTLGIVDIKAISEIAHQNNSLLIVDNTFATPYLQQPLLLGADVVVHSTTKYIGGHSDVVGGMIVTNIAELTERLRFLQYAIGAVPGPMDCYLLARGIKTLAIRMDRHCENAAAIAEFLSNHAAVDRVFYPGLKNHPGHDVAARQMKKFGGMVSFTLKNGASAAKKVAEGTKIFTLAESLGAVESLIEVPAQMTHMSVANSPLEVDASLVRLSVGIESKEDLIADLETALKA